MRPRVSSRFGRTGALVPVALLTHAAQAGALQDGGSRRVESSTRESATFLLAPVGARSVGLGGSGVAARGESESILANPAAAASLERSEIYYLHGNDFGTESHVFGGVWRKGAERFGFAWYRFDLGSIEATDASGGRLGELDLRNEALVFTIGLPLAGSIEAGVSYKLVRFASDCTGACGEFDVSSTGHAFDVGVTAAGRRHAVALALRNSGSGLSIGEGAPSDPFPTRVRAGAALVLLEAAEGARRHGPGRPVGVTLSADLEETWTEFDDLDASWAPRCPSSGACSAGSGTPGRGGAARAPASAWGCVSSGCAWTWAGASTTSPASTATRPCTSRSASSSSPRP